MTQKELAYVEDAIGHEKNIIGICEQSMELIEDDSWCKYLKKEVEKHNKMKEELINLLEDNNE